jgi:hypothetical protein
MCSIYHMTDYILIELTHTLAYTHNSCPRAYIPTEDVTKPHREGVSEERLETWNRMEHEV